MQPERAWKILGETDPYFAVLTDPQFRERERFFRSGEEDIDRMFADIRGMVHPHFSPRRALDFGCGVGRLVLPLARRVERVVGVDVAPAMLAEANQNALAQGLTNIQLVCSSERGCRIEGEFDLISSLMVFQHIPVRTGMSAFRKLMTHLAPGGVGALHFIYAIDKPAAWRFAFRARQHIPGLHQLANVIGGHPVSRPPMQMNAYSLPDLFAVIRDTGCDRSAVKFTEHGPFRGVVLMFRR
jgi:2-polyprenyl-3-methyl-5-hydroxy-6-metoxy-1,4-benzoquinol methylase